VAALVVAAGAGCHPSPRATGPATAPAAVSTGLFHGWATYVISNPAAEVVVVPAIGRLMQFRLAGAAHSAPLWHHPRLGGELAPDENGWINFGGDKAWPAPQSGWEKVTGKGWPPPKTFDATPFSAAPVAGGIELVSAVDPAYGVRVRRTFVLDPTRPVLTIDTSYEKLDGAPIRIGLWTIAQLVSPERLFVELPERSSFAGGYALRFPDPPRDLRVEGRLLSLARDPARKTMLGTDGEALLWVGDGPDLLVETVAQTDGGEGWPDGAHAQIYTSSDEAVPYVELELLARLHDLRIGDRAYMKTRYTLLPRTDRDPTAEAKRVFAATASR
jgi:hypothetical protein